MKWISEQNIIHYMTFNLKDKAFIVEHREDDVRKLALLGKRHPDVDMPFVLNQIAGWQTARTKLPSWSVCDDIIYPPHISMEQCSSEQTALYKASLVKGMSMVDLTGGFGVDFSFIARNFEHSTYIERQPHLCDIAHHNFKALASLNPTEDGRGTAWNVECVNSVEYLHSMQHTDLIYIDPARRDEHGAKTYAIEDCTPNIIELQDLLLSKADTIMIKLSPMLDWHSAVEKLHNVTEVHIISVDNECKELVLVVNNENDNETPNHRIIETSNHRKNNNEKKVFCVNITREGTSTVILNSNDTTGCSPHHAPYTGKTLFVPNASIMKAGLFGQLCRKFDLAPIGRNSNLFIVCNDTESALPGRQFRIQASTTMNKRELKAAFTDIDAANIAVRNFPLSVAELRKRLKIKDGGNTYIFGTTTDTAEHILLICGRK